MPRLGVYAIGAFVEREGQTWMIVDIDGDRVVLENEDERIVRVSREEALKLLARRS